MKTKTMTYTPKTKRPTVKSMLAEIKRLREDRNSIEEALLDSGDMRATLCQDLAVISDLALYGNNFGERTKTLDKIRAIAAAAVSQTKPTS